MQTDPESLVGSTLQDRYRISAFLAEGAMGAVYRGERIGLERPVAIKFLNPSFASGSNAQQRFEREARVMSQLDHPNCVSVIDFGISPAPFIVMEFVTGETLRETLDAGPISVARALYLIKGILAGLAHAHEQKIVHRDIKPANVMITRAAGTEGLVRILDFGLAKLRDGASSDVSSASIVVGTPNYMSPEQGQGSDVDSRTDLYATGVLLFELLTGEKPYKADLPLQILLQHSAKPIPRLSETVPDREFPPGLQNVIDRAMAKRPEDRFATAIDFADALKAVESGRVDEVERLAPAIVAPAHSSSDMGAEPTVLARPAIAKPSALTADSGAPSRPAERSKHRALWIGAPLLLLLVGLAAAMGVGPFASREGRGNDGVASKTASAGKTESAGSAGSATSPLARSALADSETAGGAESNDDAPSEALTEDEAAPQPDAAVGLLATLEAGLDELDDDDDEDEEELSAEELAADTPNVDPPVEETGEVAPSAPVRTIADAVRLASAGEREAAISGLRQLIRSQPKNARLSLALGNLYFEQMWWTSALEQYNQAIRKNRKLSKNPTLIKNAIRALGSSKTRGKARGLLRVRVGKPSIAHLRRASKKDSSPLVRKRAATLLRQMTQKKSKRSRKKKKKKRRRPRPHW